MNAIPWYKCGPAFQPYWDNMIKRGLFPLNKVVTDLREKILDFGGQHTPSVIDLRPLNGRLEQELSGACHYNKLNPAQSQDFTTFDYQKFDFAISGPIGPWRLRLDEIVCDELDIDRVVTSLRNVSSQVETILIFNDVLPPRSIHVNGPGDGTLHCVTERLSDTTHLLGNPTKEIHNLIVLGSHNEDRGRVAVAQHIFKSGAVLSAAGLKVCHMTEQFSLVMKRE